MSVGTAPRSPVSHGSPGLLGSSLEAGRLSIWPTPEAVPGGTVTSNETSHASIRVLVVDDDPLNRMIMSSLLASRGLVPMLAEDGAEALALACELRFDLILMDLQMPILGGLEATSALRRFEQTSLRPAVPVIACSSTNPGANVLALHGMSGSLNKPCTGKEMEDCLAQWCPTFPSVHGTRRAAHEASAAS